jgi:hypothetical protein
MSTTSNALSLSTVSTGLTASTTGNTGVYAGGKFVLLGTNQCAYSTDGLSWTLGTIPAGGWGTGAVAYANGTYLAVAADSTTVATSTDGITWTAGPPLPVACSARAVGRIDNMWFVVKDTASALVSLDGASWTSVVCPGIQRLCSFGNKLIAATSSGMSYTTDGFTWVAAPTTTSLGMMITVASDGNVLVATRYNFDAVYSYDGVTWYASGFTNEYPYSVAGDTSERGFLAIFPTIPITIWSSPDGLSWSKSTGTGQSAGYVTILGGAGRYATMAYNSTNAMVMTPNGVVVEEVVVLGGSDYEPDFDAPDSSALATSVLIVVGADSIEEVVDASGFELQISTLTVEDAAVADAYEEDVELTDTVDANGVGWPEDELVVETAIADERAYSVADDSIEEVADADELPTQSFDLLLEETGGVNGDDTEPVTLNETASADELLDYSSPSDLEETAIADEITYPDSMCLCDDPATADDALISAAITSASTAENQVTASDQLYVIADQTETSDTTADEPELGVELSIEVMDTGGIFGEVVYAPTADVVEDTAAADESTEHSAVVDMSCEAISTGDELYTFTAVAAVELAEMAEMANEVIASEVATPIVESNSLVIDVAAADEAPLTVTDLVVEELTVVDEIVEPQSISSYSVASDATTTDEPAATLVSVAEVTDGAVAVDLLDALLAGATSPLTGAATTATAWVMNTESTAVNWYSNWGFTDMAVTVSGKVFAVGPNGLTVVAGNTDDGEIIPARVVFDRQEFGGYDNDGTPLPDEHKKRVKNLFIGYRSTTAMRATLEAWGPTYGAYSYTMHPHINWRQHNDRIVPGKGLVSRYWKLSIENTAGGDFEVNSLSADIALSTRRI